MQRMDLTEWDADTVADCVREYPPRYRYRYHDEHEARTPRRLHWLNMSLATVVHGGRGIRMEPPEWYVIMRGQKWGANNCPIGQLIAIRL